MLMIGLRVIIVRGHWCDIVLNVHAPTEDKSGEIKDSFYEEVERVFDQFRSLLPVPKPPIGL
jgi:hypothetical protein